jgi:hypothetical protein
VDVTGAEECSGVEYESRESFDRRSRDVDVRIVSDGVEREWKSTVLRVKELAAKYEREEDRVRAEVDSDRVLEVDCGASEDYSNGREEEYNSRGSVAAAIPQQVNREPNRIGPRDGGEGDWHSTHSEQ